MPDATVLKENKYGKSLCDIDALWCQREVATHVRFQKFLIIEKSHGPSNCTELTGISNEEIVYTLLNVFK